MNWSSVALWFSFITSVIFWAVIMILITPAADGEDDECDRFGRDE